MATTGFIFVVVVFSSYLKDSNRCCCRFFSCDGPHIRIRVIQEKLTPSVRGALDDLQFLSLRSDRCDGDPLLFCCQAAV